MKTIEYLKPYPALLQRAKGSFLETFVISNVELIAVKNHKNIEIIYNGVSFYNNLGRQSMTVSELKNSLEQNALKCDNFKDMVKNWCNKQMELPIKEKVIIDRPKKVYHKFVNFKGDEIQNLKGFCVYTFECNDLHFEVFRYKKINYICFDSVCVSTGDEKSFMYKIQLYDYDTQKIKNWIKTQTEIRITKN